MSISRRSPGPRAPPARRRTGRSPQGELPQPRSASSARRAAPRPRARRSQARRHRARRASLDRRGRDGQRCSRSWRLTSPGFRPARRLRPRPRGCHAHAQRPLDRCPASATPSSPARAGSARGIYASLNCGYRLGRRRRSGCARTAARAGTAHRRSRPSALVTLHQVHSAQVVAVERPWRRERVAARRTAWSPTGRGIALGILTADCAPVLFADPEARRDRRGACRLARRARAACSRRRSRRWRGSAPSRAHPRRDRPLHRASPPTRSGRNSMPASSAADADDARFFRPPRAPGITCSTCPAMCGARLERLGVADAVGRRRHLRRTRERFFSYRRTTLAGEKRLRPRCSRRSRLEE